MVKRSVALVGAVVFPLLFLSACATMLDGSSQPVKFLALGATNVACDVMVGENDLHYRVFPPQKVWMKRTDEALRIECQAPGNRVKSAVIEPGRNRFSALNLFNGGFGLFYDAASGARNIYPDIISVDFSGESLVPDLLPSYYNADVLVPGPDTTEYRGASVPALPGDAALAARHKEAEAEYERQVAAEAALEAERESRKAAIEGEFNGDKGRGGGPKTPPASDSSSPSL